MEISDHGLKPWAESIFPPFSCSCEVPRHGDQVWLTQCGWSFSYSAILLADISSLWRGQVSREDSTLAAGAVQWRSALDQGFQVHSQEQCDVVTFPAWWGSTLSLGLHTTPSMKASLLSQRNGQMTLWTVTGPCSAPQAAGPMDLPLVGMRMRPPQSFQSTEFKYLSHLWNAFSNYAKPSGGFFKIYFYIFSYVYYIHTSIYIYFFQQDTFIIWEFHIIHPNYTYFPVHLGLSSPSPGNSPPPNTHNRKTINQTRTKFSLYYLYTHWSMVKLLVACPLKKTESFLTPTHTEAINCGELTSASVSN